MEYFNLESTMSLGELNSAITEQCLMTENKPNESIHISTLPFVDQAEISSQYLNINEDPENSDWLLSNTTDVSGLENASESYFLPQDPYNFPTNDYTVLQFDADPNFNANTFSEASSLGNDSLNLTVDSGVSVSDSLNSNNFKDHTPESVQPALNPPKKASRRYRRSTPKTKLYQKNEPCSDPEEELKRRNAHKAKKNRDKQKQMVTSLQAEKESLKSQVSAQQAQISSLLSEITSLKQKEERRKNTLQSIQEQLGLALSD